MIFKIEDLDSKLKISADFLKVVKISDGLKIAVSPIFMKFGTQNKSNRLIMNILFGIDDLN